MKGGKIMLKFAMSVVTLFLIVLLVSAALAFGRFGRRGSEDVRVPVKMITESAGRGDYGTGDYGREIRVDRHTRYYDLHVPSLYDKSRPVPVVMVFHGGGGDPGTIRYESGMDTTSDRGGFIVVYPAGTNKRLVLKNRLLLWNDGRPDKNGEYSKVDDVGFMVALLDDLNNLFNIDKKRIYACGYSNGAQLTYRLAKRLSDRIAAIATVAGNRPVKDEYDPLPSRTMSIMQFSGKEDPLSPYQGGRPPGAAALTATIEPVSKTITSWIDFNKCSREPTVERVGKAVMNRWGPCQGGAEVVLWTLEDGGHTWPGGRIFPKVKMIGLGEMGNVNQDINASDLMWEFFKKHPLQ